ncbi:MAG: hypothetical protein QF437_11785, partial [Planctomycetota bacterium]|nr:hypothetical protein [Planctomycetota bacterium]
VSLSAVGKAYDARGASRHLEKDRYRAVFVVAPDFICSARMCGSRRASKPHLWRKRILPGEHDTPSGHLASLNNFWGSARFTSQ